MLAAVLALLLQACGGGSSQNAQPASQTEPLYSVVVQTTGAGTVTSLPAGINCGATCSAPFAGGTSLSLTATPAAGYNFVGWGNGTCTGTGGCNFTVNSGTVITAAFQSQTGGIDYVLTLDQSGTGAVQVAPSTGANVQCASSCSLSLASGTTVTLTAQPGSGYSFGGWTGACAGVTPASNTSCTVTLNANETVGVKFNSGGAAQYTLSLQETGSGTVSFSDGSAACTSSCSKTYNSGTSVTLTAQPASGFNFTGWGGACSGTGPCSLVLSANLSVSASFASGTPTQFPLSVSLSNPSGGTVTSSPAGINCGSACSANFNSGTAVTLTEQPAAGYDFAGWSVSACGTSSTCQVNVNAATSVTARFTAQASSYVLSVANSNPAGGTISSSPTGISCGSSCSSSYSSGTVVTLTAAPASGDTFSGWGGAGASCGTALTCAVTVSAATSVSAGFAGGTSGYLLTVSDLGSGTGTVTSSPTGINCGSSCTASFASGTSVTLTATPGSGDTISSWGGACAATPSTSTTCTVSMAAAQSVTVNFAAPSGACAQGASSIVYSFTYPAKTGSNVYSYTQFGNYNVSFDDWGPQNGTLTQWINSPSCWGMSDTNNSSEQAGSVWSYPNVSRGWTNNATQMQRESTSGYPSAPSWTTDSGMGIQVSAIQKVHVKWSLTTPTTPNVGDTVSRWDALIDIYLHTTSNPPSTSWPPMVDLQIMQILMDQPLTGQPANLSGWYAAVLNNNHGWVKTIGGVTYAGMIDWATGYNASGGHLITMIPEPTMWTNPTNPSSNALLNGQSSTLHDVGGILAWLSSSNPLDDSGNPIKNGAGTVITTPLISPSLYLTAINAGIETDFTSSGNDQWVTNDFWVAVQNEPDGN